MGVFTFVLSKESATDQWSGKQMNGDLASSADSTFDLQRKLVQCALSTDSGPVHSSFTFVTPSSAVFQGDDSEEDDLEYDVMDIYNPDAAARLGKGAKKDEESEEDDLEVNVMDLYND